MARSRPIQTFYGAAARRKLDAGWHSSRGHAATPYGAVLAAARRFLRGEWARCDIYVTWNGRHAFTVRKDRRSVVIERHGR